MKFFFLSVSLLTVFFVGCEKPDISPATPEPKAEPQKAAPAAPVSEPAAAPEPKEVAPAPLENAEPFISIKFEGKAIAIVGSIKSNLQKKKLLEYLGKGFPDHEITDELEVDYRRIAVGWGNRFGNGYIGPFFEQVPEGTFEYKDGVVKLTGEVPDQPTFRDLVMSAGEMFMGDFTQDIDSSELVVKPK